MAMVCVSYFDALERHSKFVSPSGNGYVDVYELRRSPKSNVDELVKTGKKSLFDEIQAYKESTDISNILTRFINGEVDILNQVDGFYADVTDAPTSYADYFAKVKEAKIIFDNLPEEIKVKFNNDPEKFFTEFGNESIVSDIKEEINDESEVVNNAE